MMKFIAPTLERRSLNLILYCFVILLVAKDHLALSKSIFRSSQEAGSNSDDLVDYLDRQQTQAQVASDDEQQSDTKINGLLEKYLISSSSSSSTSSKRRKPSSSSRISELDEEIDYDNNNNNNWNDDRQKPEISRLASRSSNAENEQLHRLVKKFRTPNANKRAWDIQTYYDILLQNDGSILLIPKDVNKNHYFIG